MLKLNFALDKRSLSHYPNFFPAHYEMSESVLFWSVNDAPASRNIIQQILHSSVESWVSDDKHGSFKLRSSTGWLRYFALQK